MPTIGFLHTAESHVATFSALVEDIDAGCGHVHSVRPDLLQRARDAGTVDRDVEADLAAEIHGLAAGGADIVICTCSTLGESAERCSPDADLMVLRVDRPMAELAVRDGTRTAVIFALESTLAPTRALLQECARVAGREVDIIDVPCLEAWSRFEQGDIAGYHRVVASTVDGLDRSIDVAVLAQASMAGAAPLVKSGLTVLTSPRIAVDAAVKLTARGV